MFYLETDVVCRNFKCDGLCFESDMFSISNLMFVSIYVLLFMSMIRVRLIAVKPTT